MESSCLNCGAGLIPRRSRIGIFQHCPSCNSRLVGFHLLRHLLPKSAADHLWIKGHENSKGQRACPLCRREMSETGLPNDPIVLDLCTHCHMVWFDSGEFEAEPFKPLPEYPVLRMDLAERRRYAAEMIAVQKEMASEDDSFRRPENVQELALAILGFPIEYGNPISRRPFVTWGTALSVIVVSLIAFIDLETAAGRFGFVPETAFRWGGATLLTSFFIHGGFFHLAGNLYFLLVFGDNVEDRLGPLRFVGLLAAATIFANLASLFLSSGVSRVVPHIGASGGISALLSVYALSFPKARIGIFFYFHILKLPAVALLVLWVLIQIMGAMFQVSGATMVDYGAHLGGAATGVLFWWLWGKKA